MSTTTSTRPAQPEPTVKELQEALDKARDEYEYLVGLHNHHMEAYDDAHKGVHGAIYDEEERHLISPIVLACMREMFEEDEVIKDEHEYAQDMANAREAVKEVRTQLKEVTERITVLERQLAAKK